MAGSILVLTCLRQTRGETCSSVATLRLTLARHSNRSPNSGERGAVMKGQRCPTCHKPGTHYCKVCTVWYCFRDFQLHIRKQLTRESIMITRPHTRWLDGTLEPPDQPGPSHAGYSGSSSMHAYAGAATERETVP
jgi:hypothetical protein